MAKSKLSNPAALAAISAAKTPAGQSAIKQTGTALKALLIIGGSYLAYTQGRIAYKKYLAEKYAKENIGNPNLIAAAIIYNSFTRFEPTGLISLILPSFEIATDEAALNQIATQITNVQDVSDAYTTLFDRSLFFDTQNGLSTTELQTFWNIINAESINTDNSVVYPIGSILYAASKAGILVNEAVKQNNTWSGTNNIYKKINYNSLVGKVVHTGVVPEGMTGAGKTYYIVQEVRWTQCLTNCDFGVVLHEQVNNKKI